MRAVREVTSVRDCVARGSTRRAEQGELGFRSWGGARRGAGRKPKGARALVPHIARPAHKARFPVLITSRLRSGLPSLRRSGEAALVRAALASTNLDARARAGGSAPFQVVHHSIQSNHLHLIVEAPDRRALTRGLRGLLVRIARALNRLWKSSGSVFADRFHEHELRQPLQVRNALVYVLQNLRKHGIHLHGPDPFSSGPEFDGWRRGGAQEGWTRETGVPCGTRTTRGGGGAGSTAPQALLRAARAETPRPRTWLLDVGWRRHGWLDPGECPRAH